MRSTAAISKDTGSFVPAGSTHSGSVARQLATCLAIPGAAQYGWRQQHEVDRVDPLVDRSRARLFNDQGGRPGINRAGRVVIRIACPAVAHRSIERRIRVGETVGFRTVSRNTRLTSMPLRVARVCSRDATRTGYLLRAPFQSVRPVERRLNFSGERSGHVDRALAPMPTDAAFFESTRLGFGGESGIRTHGRVSPTHAFQACSFNHSDISPFRINKLRAASHSVAQNPPSSLADPRCNLPSAVYGRADVSPASKLCQTSYVPRSLTAISLSCWSEMTRCAPTICAHH